MPAKCLASGCHYTLPITDSEGREVAREIERQRFCLWTKLSSPLAQSPAEGHRLEESGANRKREKRPRIAAAHSVYLCPLTHSLTAFPCLYISIRRRLPVFAFFFFFVPGAMVLSVCITVLSGRHTNTHFSDYYDDPVAWKVLSEFILSVRQNIDVIRHDRITKQLCTEPEVQGWGEMEKPATNSSSHCQCQLLPAVCSSSLLSSNSSAVNSSLTWHNIGPALDTKTPKFHSVPTKLSRPQQIVVDS